MSRAYPVRTSFTFLALAFSGVALSCCNTAGSSGSGNSGNSTAIEVIFVADGENGKRDAVAARCAFHAAPTPTNQSRGRTYEGDRNITEAMLDCLRNQPEVERVALGG